MSHVSGALVMWYLGSKGVFARCVSVLFVVVKDFTVPVERQSVCLVRATVPDPL